MVHEKSHCFKPSAHMRTLMHPHMNHMQPHINLCQNRKLTAVCTTIYRDRFVCRWLYESAHQHFHLWIVNYRNVFLRYALWHVSAHDRVHPKWNNFILFWITNTYVLNNFCSEKRISPLIIWLTQIQIQIWIKIQIWGRNQSWVEWVMMMMEWGLTSYYPH